LNSRTILINWTLLLGLVALWGTSFMFTAISVSTVDPISVVFYRLALGALVLSLVVYARGHSIPRDWRTWAGFLVMAIVGNALPFFLISWGQQEVDSGVAGMIMAIMPLLTMVFAHYFVVDEKLNRYKLIGFALGITGVTLLLGPVFEGGGREEWPGNFYRGKLLCRQFNPDQAPATLQPDGGRLRCTHHGKPGHVAHLAGSGTRK
jgi:drug/metabolite transporter (DMT)-like permease